MTFLQGRRYCYSAFCSCCSSPIATEHLLVDDMLMQGTCHCGGALPPRAYHEDLEPSVGCRSVTVEHGLNSQRTTRAFLEQVENEFQLPNHASTRVNVQHVPTRPVKEAEHAQTLIPRYPRWACDTERKSLAFRGSLDTNVSFSIWTQTRWFPNQLRKSRHGGSGQ
jgi:hypothetical protein